ncbi:MAG: aminopeptidase [Sandaracinus sp.]|nr:aminopeptidase [Sandaracinus sp.]|tara:strand:- start:3173 stop:4630 length:1458 start_codon:yes stop_codon:yes gene_type:complete
MTRSAERSIGRQLAVGFGSIATVAALLCVGLLFALVRVDATLERVREDGVAAREALSLSLSVREHYLHESHTVIQHDSGQVGPHEAWLVDLQRRARALQAAVPVSERARLETLMRQSRSLDEVFRTAVLPAALARDHERLQQAHAVAGRHLERATDAADAVARSLEERMVAARRRAQEATALGMLLGCIGVLTILVLAIGFSLHLRRAISRPLGLLAEAAERFGRGETQADLGELGVGEIRVVARAFDAMAEGIREREAALVRSERLAAIGQLAAGVAHEINNPVAVIRGYLRTMVPEARDESQATELRILDQEAAACQRIVDDLLAYGRDPDLSLERLGTRAFLGDAARRFASTDLGSGVDLARDIEDAKLEVDPVRMRQVVDNLLSNAAEFSEAGATVVLRGALLDQDTYRIEVLDRGPGIPEDQRERVFEPFRSSRPGGTGLGLAISRVIVSAHRGQIRAVPRPGGGSSIQIDLPRAQESGR